MAYITAYGRFSGNHYWTTGNNVGTDVPIRVVGNLDGTQTANILTAETRDSGAGGADSVKWAVTPTGSTQIKAPSAHTLIAQPQMVACVVLTLHTAASTRGINSDHAEHNVDTVAEVRTNYETRITFDESLGTANYWIQAQYLEWPTPSEDRPPIQKLATSTATYLDIGHDDWEGSGTQKIAVQVYLIAT